MYAIVKDKEVTSVGEISVLFPNISFPASEEYGNFVKENNLYEVVNTIEHDSNTEKVIPCDPYLKNKKVYTVKVETMSAEEQKNILNAHVDFELMISEWTESDTQMPAKNKKDWQKYREKLQALKDRSNLSEVTWPEKPVYSVESGDK